MKKLGCLLPIIVIILIIGGLIYTGVITETMLYSWADRGLSGAIGLLQSLQDELRSKTGATEEEKASLLLVNAEHPLPDGYEPAPMVRLFDQKRHFLLARDDLYLTEEVFEAANRMFKAAEDEGLNGFIMTSAYRSRDKQEEIYQESAAGLAQKPGCSEHETGLAFDVTARTSTGSFAYTEQCRWLLAHCHEYGFIQRYPEGKESITGISYEPWHYRYVGVETAKKMKRLGVTLEEYLGG
ncbi:MAG: M15 family metallopeptidase [Clostridia bacterium]|nr:M15 family metallopeptidase [Clostridia bacterium]